MATNSLSSSKGGVKSSDCTSVLYHYPCGGSGDEDEIEGKRNGIY